MPVNQYIRITKNVLNANRHEEVELHSYGEVGMAKLTQVVNVLSTWGYIQVKRIKVLMDPGLKICIQRTPEF